MNGDDNHTFDPNQPTINPQIPGIGIPSSPWVSPSFPTEKVELIPGTNKFQIVPTFEWGPLGPSMGPRRPVPGGGGFFYDECSGTISAGVVERIEFEQDGDKTIIYCVVRHGEEVELTYYVHEQCFYHNQDAIAYGVAAYEEKQSGPQ